MFASLAYRMTHPHAAHCRASRQIHSGTLPPERLSVRYRLFVHFGRRESLEAGHYDQTGSITLLSKAHFPDRRVQDPVRHPGTTERSERQRSRSKRSIYDVQVSLMSLRRPMLNNAYYNPGTIKPPMSRSKCRKDLMTVLTTILDRKRIRAQARENTSK